jgi:uncharacterized protein (TIGR03118 family)
MRRRSTALALSLATLLMFVSTAALGQYQRTNLTSNQFGLAANTDPLLVNAWGLVHGPGTPWWISDNNSGWSTLYNAAGVRQNIALVEIPGASGGIGQPTGNVFFAGWPANKEFKVNGWSALFLFATLDGTISGWTFLDGDPNDAIIAVTAPGASYTGLAITNRPSNNRLFAADNTNNKVDVYDSNFTHIKSFTDKTTPKNFAPFGIRDFDGFVYVTFADNTGGPGGFVDIFSEDGVFLRRLTSDAHLNQPWGLAAAPSGFGPLSNTLLVSNNTNIGTINGFNAITGDFVGTVKDTSGNSIVIDQLWAIDFGDGFGANGPKNTLFFTAGPDNNFAGLFGSIVFK